MSRVKVYFVASCVYLISQILNKELWTRYMADSIWQALLGGKAPYSS